jgi:hypothetical protein
MSFCNRSWRNPKRKFESESEPLTEPVRKWINPKLLSAPEPEFYIDTKGEEVINRTWRKPNIVAATVPSVEVSLKRPRYWDTDGSVVTTSPAPVPVPVSVSVPVSVPVSVSVSVSVPTVHPGYFASQPDFVPL